MNTPTVSFSDFKDFCFENKDSIINCYDCNEESYVYYPICSYIVRYVNGKQYCGIDISKIKFNNCSPYTAVLYLMTNLYCNGIHIFSNVLNTVMQRYNRKDYTLDGIVICECIIEHMFTNGELWLEKVI